MAKTNMARVERSALADLLIRVGPDEPTLCGDWTTRDLAAHLVVRDRRPDAAAGIAFKPLAGHNERVRGAYARSRPYPQLVDAVRHPPLWALAAVPPLDRATNTGEFFIHHEDVRRAQPDWEPRPLGADLAAALAGQVRLAGKLRLRRFPAAITVDMPGFPPIRTGAGGPEVTLTGDPGEMTMFLSGRQRVSRVRVDGPDDVVEKLRTAPFGP